MAQTGTSKIPDILAKYKADILTDWTRQQLESMASRRGAMREGDITEQSTEFLNAFVEAAAGNLTDLRSEKWDAAREVLAAVSRSRAKKGFTPSETAMFVFSLKQPILTRLRAEIGDDVDAVASEGWTVNEVLDRLGLFTMEVYQKGREEVIFRQQQELMELSTPVVSLWENVLALPLIGTLDSARTQVVMESLLQAIVKSGAAIAIIDITGVPTVDTLVAQHLLKTVAAARLMGADCIISGIRPQIAQTIVHLGVDLGDVITKATLADAFALALQRSGMMVVSIKGRS
ncbi:MAG: STAS domain-containing protein [Candidatus Kapaibacterium sp.]